jgi:hypothetical protein
MNLFRSRMWKCFTAALIIYLIPSTYASANTCLVSIQDTIKDYQILYNGKLWRNTYFLVKGDQFLYSKEFLPGSVTVRGKSFDDILLKYDLFKDELITPITGGGILQINKEMVDSFSLSFNNYKYHFIMLPEDSLKGAKTYFNILYNGKTLFLIRYIKKIDKLAVEETYDKFYQITKLYVLLGKNLVQVTGKKDILNLFIKNEAQIKDYIKANKLRISDKIPESFIPVIRYYDSLIH